MACCSNLHQVKVKEEQNTRVGPTDRFEQSKEKNYPPTSLVTSALCLLLVGRCSLCALCPPSGSRGESRRTGDGNPALLLLCSNWPQQPAAASRSDFLVPKGNAIKNSRFCHTTIFIPENRKDNYYSPSFFSLSRPQETFSSLPHGTLGTNALPTTKYPCSQRNHRHER